MRHLRGVAVALVAAVSAAACDADVVADPSSLLTPTRPAAALVPLDPFGIGDHSPGSKGCSAEGYRQFDFWVGKWDVFGFGNTLVGTSVIESELGGCAIEENWTAAFGGGTGKSLNTYDAATGTWSQLWVGSGGCPFGTALLEGGFADGSMTMQGTREQPEGFVSGPPCAPPPNTVVFKRTDYYRWTRLENGSVLQQIAAANDDSPLVLPPPPSTGIGLRYDAVETVTPINAPPRGSFCTNRAAAKQFDFMLGSWDVHQGNGNGAQGTATFTKTVTNCLVEEQFAGPGGYAGMSYNTFDVFTQQWVRTYVDTDGQRLFMTGGLVDGSMVLTGTKHGSAGRSVEVRIAWEPAGDGQTVAQRWSYSLDGGATWEAEKEVVYTRR